MKQCKTKKKKSKKTTFSGKTPKKNKTEVSRKHFNLISTNKYKLMKLKRKFFAKSFENCNRVTIKFARNSVFKKKKRRQAHHEISINFIE